MIWYSSGWRIRLRRTTKRNNYINVKMSEKGSRLLGKSRDPFSLTGYRARTAFVPAGTAFRLKEYVDAGKTEGTGSCIFYRAALLSDFSAERA